MKLAAKLMVLFLLLTTIPLAVVGYLAYENGRRTIEQGTLNRLISTTIYKEDEFERWVRGNERTLRSLAERPFFKDQFTAEMVAHDPANPEHPKVHRMIREDHFLPILEEEGGFIELFILRASDGLILVSTDEKEEEKYRESEPYFVEGKNRTYVGNVVYSLALGEAAMTIATPIRDRDGNLIAVLAGHADLAEMSEIMTQRSGLSGSEETYLVNAFNFFVTEPRFGQGYALKEALYTEGVEACLAHNSFDQAQDRDGVGFYEDYRGVPVIGAYRWLPERELCILTEEDQAEAYAPIVALRNTVLGIGVSVALVAALLGMFFARTITGPLDQLVRGAEEIGRGNLEYRIEVASRDEIGQLATAFNEMAAKRKQAGQALQESEQWLSTTLRSIGDAVIATDAKGLVTLMNPVAEDLTGCDEVDAVGKPLEDVFNIINEQTGERAENPVARVLREGVVVGLANHTVLIAKDGTKRPIADSGAPMRDEEGNIIGTVMVFRDITESKRAEDLTRTQYDLGLALSTARGLDETLRLCLEAAIHVSEMDSGGIYLVDETSGVVAIVSHRGLPPGFVESASHFDADSDQARLVMAGAPIYTEHLALGVELSEAERRESLRALAIVPVRYEDRVIGCLNVASHIRDEVPNHARAAIEAIATQIGSAIAHTKAQEALRESEEKYRNLTESLDELIYRADPDTFVATYVNSAVETLYGYTVKEWLADPTLWEYAIHPDDQKRVFAAFTKARRSLESDAIEYRILRKDKTVRWVQNRAGWQKGQQGNVVSMNGVIYDITERKEMQERLVRQEKLAILGQLAGGVGHELRNPLGVISNAIYFLQLTLPDAGETTREYLGIIGSEVHNAERIVSDLLDFARTRIPEREEIAVADLVAQVLEKRPPPEDVQVTTQMPSDLPPVFVDPRQMGRVLDNLVTNGYQAMPEGGRLTIHVLEGEGIGRPGDDLPVTPSPCLRVSISDTGCGIPKENREKIFEPLFTTKAKGIGLGLAITKSLTEANGGSIEVESPSTGLRAGEEGQGSTFTVTLPTKEAVA